MAARIIGADLLTYMDKRVGQVLHVDTISQDTKLTHKQVQNGINNLRNARGNDHSLDLKASIQVVTRGSAWMYRPVTLSNAAPPSPGKPTTSPRLFTEVGPTRDGAIIIQCEDGNLFRAEEL